MIRSLASVLYPLSKFDVLIVDDGSAIPLSKKDLSKNNPGINIHIIRLEKNEGIVNALNIGLDWIKKNNDFKYIARLDTGDTCHSERFCKQVEFLNGHPEISLLGSWCRFENSQTKEGYDYISKTAHEDIIKEMHLKCSFIHPTVMFRNKILDIIGNYPTGFPHAEDYAYFWQILKKCKVAILPEFLTRIDYSSNNISAKNYKKQLISRIRVVKNFGTSFYYKIFGIIMLWIRILSPVFFINWIKQINEKQ